MDKLGETGYFLLNLIMILLISLEFFGIHALIFYGIVMAPIGLITVFCLFFEAGTGYTPYGFVRSKFVSKNRKVIDLT